MSRGRNRNIRALPLQDVPLYFPLPEEISITSIQKEQSKKTSTISNCFGEHVHSNKGSSPRFDPNYCASSALSDSDDDEELEKLIWGFKDLGGKSSSSSLSWGEDDCGSEASKKVQEELERMDRVLGGLEPIPPNYDKEEYEEWMKFFPNLCAVGTAMKVPKSSAKRVRTGYNSTEEVLAIHPEDCDTPNFLSDSESLKNQIKKAIVEQVYDKVTDRLSQHNTAKNIKESRDSNLLNVDNYLKISQSVFRERSSKYLISSHISSSKWLKDDSECASLPFLHDTFEKVQTRTSYSNTRDLVRPVKGILKNSLTLPPIESSQFRSISATPRRPANKCLSALSVNAKSRLDSSSYSELMKNSYRKKSGIGRARTRKKVDDFK